MRVFSRIVMGLAAANLLAAAPVAALVIRQPLATTGVDADAGGSARVVVKGRGARRHATLRVEVRRLAAGARYDVTVDGTSIGSLATSRRGRGRAAFTTRSGAALPALGVDPRGRMLGIAGDGVVVLSTRVDDRGLDPNDVRCCLPDDSGPECEDRTAAECAAAGGTNLGAGSCLPNPCSTTSTTLPGGGGAARVEVTCERRSGRSKISVDGKGLAPGRYRAQASSGGNVASSAAAEAVGDEAEFDFDSEPDDVRAGATPIAGDFITGNPPRVRGSILDAVGNLVAEGTATCDVR